MTIQTSVPAIQFTGTGLVLPTEAQILAGVQADQQTANGGSVTPTLTSPSGQEAQSYTAIIGDKNNEIASIVNNLNPDNASGRWQDAIGRIYFQNRIEGAGSVTAAACVGLVGQTVQAGVLVQDASGYLWAATQAFTFDSNGQASPQFQCQTDGPITIPSGALTIYKATTGWDSCTFNGSGTLGNLVESQYDFEYRRKQSVAINSVNMVASIRAAVFALEGVLDVFVVDNPSGNTVNYGATNYPLAPHSVFVGVVGGTAEEIALAIWNNKSGGCSYNGNTSQIVYDTAALTQPYPQYIVEWNIPTNVPVYFTVSLAANANLPANIVSLVQAAVVASFNGEDGGSRARQGSQLYAGRYYANVAAQDSNVQIYEITLGTTASPSGTALLLGIDQNPTLTAANVAVTLS